MLLLNLMAMISSNFESKKYSIGIFLDLSKALDVIDHKLNSLLNHNLCEIDCHKLGVNITLFCSVSILKVCVLSQYHFFLAQFESGCSNQLYSYAQMSLQKMIAMLHIPELQKVLGLLKMSKYGKKSDLTVRLLGVSHGLPKAVQGEIESLYRYGA